ncbi:hypothetical protein JCM11641_006088 [Rhodosporidiobolus odoratus]
MSRRPPSSSKRPADPSSKLHRRKELGAETNADGYLAAIALNEVLQREGKEGIGAFTAVTSLEAILRRGLKDQGNITARNPAFTCFLKVDAAGCEFTSLDAKDIQDLDGAEVKIHHLDPNESMEPARGVLSLLNISVKKGLAEVELHVTEHYREEAQTRTLTIRIAYGYSIQELNKFLVKGAVSSDYLTSVPLVDDHGDLFRPSGFVARTLPVWQGCAVFLCLLHEVVSDYYEQQHSPIKKWRFTNLYFLLLLLWAAEEGIVDQRGESKDSTSSRFWKDVEGILKVTDSQTVANCAECLQRMVGQNVRGSIETEFARFWEHEHKGRKVSDGSFAKVTKAFRWGLKKLVELLPLPEPVDPRRNNGSHPSTADYGTTSQRRNSFAQRSQPQDHTTSRGPRLRPTRTGRPKSTYNATLDPDSDSPEPSPPPPRRSFPQQAAPTGHSRPAPSGTYPGAYTSARRASFVQTQPYQHPAAGSAPAFDYPLPPNFPPSHLPQPSQYGPGYVPVDRYGQPLPPGQPTFVREARGLRGPPISFNNFTSNTQTRTTRHSFSTSQRPVFSSDPVYDLPRSRGPQYETRHPFDDDDDDDDLRPRRPPHQDPRLQRTTSTRTRDKQSSRAQATSSAGREGYSSRSEVRRPDPLAEAARVIEKSRRDMEERREEIRKGRDDDRAQYVERKPNDVSRPVKHTSTGVRIVQRVSRGPEDRSRRYSYIEVARR